MPRERCLTEGCTRHYACRIRANGIQVSPRVNTTATRNWKPTPSIPDKSRGDIIYDERAGGLKSPILKADGTPLRRYDYDANRSAIDSQLRRIKRGASTP